MIRQGLCVDELLEMPVQAFQSVDGAHTVVAAARFDTTHSAGRGTSVKLQLEPGQGVQVWAHAATAGRLGIGPQSSTLVVGGVENVSDVTGPLTAPLL